MNPEPKGKVFLVGAGPGDPGLLTLKGKRCLECADVVIYDYLVNERLLAYAPPAAERICVGKQAGEHRLPQEEINRLVIERALGCAARPAGGMPAPPPPPPPPPEQPVPERWS